VVVEFVPGEGQGVGTVFGVEKMLEDDSQAGAVE
jgi:hypothetical protein